MGRKKRMADEEFLKIAGVCQSVKEIAEKTGYGISTVRNRLQAIEDAELAIIAQEKLEDIRSGKEKTYVFTNVGDMIKWLDSDEPNEEVPVSWTDAALNIPAPITGNCAKCGREYTCEASFDDTDLCEYCWEEKQFELAEFTDFWDTWAKSLKEIVNNSPDDEPYYESGEYGDGYDAGWFSAIAHFGVVDEGDKKAEWHRDHHDALLMDEGWLMGHHTGYWSGRKSGWRDGIDLGQRLGSASTDIHHPDLGYDSGYNDGLRDAMNGYTPGSRVLGAELLDDLDTAWDEAQAENETYHVGYHQGYLNGIDAGIQAMAEEENIDATMDRAMLLRMLPEFDKGWHWEVQKEWLFAWTRLMEEL
jgi:hypothetical protein